MRPWQVVAALLGAVKRRKRRKIGRTRSACNQKERRNGILKESKNEDRWRKGRKAKFKQELRGERRGGGAEEKK